MSYASAFLGAGLHRVRSDSSLCPIPALRVAGWETGFNDADHGENLLVGLRRLDFGYQEWWLTTNPKYGPDSQDDPKPAEHKAPPLHIPSWAAVPTQEFWWSEGDHITRTASIRTGFPIPCVIGTESHDFTPVPRYSTLLNVTSLGLQIPLRPQAIRFAGNSLIYAALLLVPAFLQRMRRVRLGRCPRCGYDLRGTDSRGQCPECGDSPGSPRMAPTPRPASTTAPAHVR